MRSFSILVVTLLFLGFCLALLITQRLRRKRIGLSEDHLSLRKEFRFYSFKSGLALSVIFVVGCYFLTNVSYNSSMQYFKDFLPDYAVYAGKKYFYFPMAICLTGILIHPVAYLIDKIFISEGYDRYMKYTKQLYGFNLRQLGMGFSTLNLTFLLFFSSFLGSHLALDNQNIYFRNVLSFDSKVYKYQDLDSMKFSPSQRINSRYFLAKPTLTLYFKDGNHFTSEGSLYDSWELKTITKNIEARTGIAPMVEFE